MKAPGASDVVFYAPGRKDATDQDRTTPGSAEVVGDVSGGREKLSRRRRWLIPDGKRNTGLDTCSSQAHDLIAFAHSYSHAILQRQAGYGLLANGAGYGDLRSRQHATHRTTPPMSGTQRTHAADSSAESTSDSTEEQAADDITDAVEASVTEELLEQQPGEDEQQALLEEHRHHLVRKTTSQVTEQRGESSIQIEATAEVPDMYCFTCEEWVGLSGVDLTGTPRSKADAYYLDGPPEDVADARDDVREVLGDLAGHVIETVDHVDDVEAALEFVGEQHEALVRAAVEVET